MGFAKKACNTYVIVGDETNVVSPCNVLAWRIGQAIHRMIGLLYREVVVMMLFLSAVALLCWPLAVVRAVELNTPPRIATPEAGISTLEGESLSIGAGWCIHAYKAWIFACLLALHGNDDDDID